MSCIRTHHFVHTSTFCTDYIRAVLACSKWCYLAQSILALSPPPPASKTCFVTVCIFHDIVDFFVLFCYPMCLPCCLWILIMRAQNVRSVMSCVRGRKDTPCQQRLPDSSSAKLCGNNMTTIHLRTSGNLHGGLQCLLASLKDGGQH